MLELVGACFGRAGEGPGLVRTKPVVHSKRSDDQRGMTLLETVLAMALMGVVFTSVGVGVTTISRQMSSLTAQTQAIDELQVAQQAIVKEMHAAYVPPALSAPWCYSYVLAGTTVYAPSATPSTELKFIAQVNGSTVAYDIKIAGSTLTVATSASPGLCAGPWSTAQTLLTNVDASSGFFLAGCTTNTGCAALPTAPPVNWTGGSGATYSFYPSLGVNLTVDGTNNVKTTQSDSTVDVWNVEETCQADWNSDPQTSPAISDPC